MSVLTDYIRTRIERVKEWHNREPFDLDEADRVGEPSGVRTEEK